MSKDHPPAMIAAARDFVARHADELAQVLTYRDSVFTAETAHQILGTAAQWSSQLSNVDFREAVIDRLLTRNPPIVRFDRAADGATAYSTNEIIQLEDSLLTQARRWHATTGDALGQGNMDASVAAFLATPKIKAKIDGGGLAPDIEPALRAVLGDGRLHLVAGPPGVGKSLLALGLVVASEFAKRPVMVCGPSDIITAGIMTDAKAPGMPLTEILSLIDAGRSPIQPNSVFILDEAGMVGTRQMAALFDELKKKNASVFLLGDPQQIGPIEAGHPFRVMAQALPYTTLTELFRQSYADDKDCTNALWHGKPRAAIESYDARGLMRFSADAEATINAAAADFVRWRMDGDHKGRLGAVLCLDDATAQKANRAVRRQLKQANALTAPAVIATAAGPLEIAIGERVQVQSNMTGSRIDKATGVETPVKIARGFAGTIEKIDADAIYLRLDDWKKGPPARIPVTPDLRLDYAYALELRRVQGITVHRAFNVFTRSLEAGEGLVALSRHKHKVTTYCDKTVFADANALIRDLERSPLKLMTSDLKADGFKCSR